MNKLDGRNRRADLEKLCNMIVNSLYRDQECYDGYSQDLKRPFGNSGGPEYDIVEELGINLCCSSCEGVGSEELSLEYARGLWEDAGELLQTATVTINHALADRLTKLRS